MRAKPRHHDESDVPGEHDRVLDQRAKARRRWQRREDRGHRVAPAWHRRRRARLRKPRTERESGAGKRGFAARKRRRAAQARSAETPVELVREATGRHGMVSTTHPEATRAGIEVLEAGGNAYDAAVAAALALCVCEPAANGLGGQSMLLLHDAAQNQTIALDGSSRAPNRATPEDIPPRKRRRGHKATTIPSTPAVYEYVLQNYGVADRATVMAPAIRLAEEGYEVSRFQAALQAAAKEDLRRGNGADYFLDQGKRPHEPGDIHRQPELAETLRRLRDHTFEDFYSGKVAARIVADMKRHGGLITAHDLKQIPWPIERDIEWGVWNGHDVASFPPAGAGRVLLQILEVADRLPAGSLDLDTPRGAVLLARNIQQALLDHREEPRDPARHTQMPTRMHGATRSRLLARRIQRGLQEGPPERPAVPDNDERAEGETSHLSVMDDQGNVVGLTQSIEEFYGACVVTGGLGFLYNNYIGAFDCDDPAHPYFLRPNAVPWSSVAPTILYKRKKPRLVLGSPGSDRIASAVAQVLIRMRSMEPMDAVAAPRLHATPEGRLHIEAERFDRDVLDALATDGFDVIQREPYSLFHGSVQLVRRLGLGGYHGVADPRRDGTAGGPT